MKYKKPILIVLGEPNSVFSEILFKVLNKLNKKNLTYPIILIGSQNLIAAQLSILKIKPHFKILDFNNFKIKKLSNKIYLADVKYNFKKPFEKISSKSKKYISNCFKKGFDYLKENKSEILINGPVSKKYFLNNKYPGVTEYVYNEFGEKISKKPVMLIFNKLLSVSPITTHIPLKNVNKNINQNTLKENIYKVHNFYKRRFKITPKIAVLGLNPHCETSSKLNEETLIIKPVIRKLKKLNIRVSGPFSADTFFLKKNIKNYNSVIGMYHDQILTPFKTLFGFDAANITLGLPFLRISVDHGPNENMMGKNLSSTESLENIFNFIKSIK